MILIINLYLNFYQKVSSLINKKYKRMSLNQKDGLISIDKDFIAKRCAGAWRVIYRKS